MNELKHRAKTLLNIVDESEFLVTAPPRENFEEKALAQLDDQGKEIITIIAESFRHAPVFNAIMIEQILKDIATKHREGKLGKVMMPLRAAITGKTTSPALPLCLEILGKDEVLSRLELT